MKIAFTIITILFAAFEEIAAQDYIVTNNGDSLFGNVKLQYKKFSVYTSAGKKDFMAENVKYVHATNFKGTTVVHCNLYQYTDVLTDLEKDYVSTKSIDTVMVLKEIYSTEKMNLYFGIDNLKTQYYFYKTPSDAAPVQLVVRYHLGGGLNAYALNPGLNRGDNSRVHIEENRGYVNQLKMAMGDCGNNIPETTWNLLHYREYSFKNLIKKYNECE